MFNRCSSGGGCGCGHSDVGTATPISCSACKHAVSNQGDSPRGGGVISGVAHSAARLTAAPGPRLGDAAERTALYKRFAVYHAGAVFKVRRCCVQQEMMVGCCAVACAYVNRSLPGHALCGTSAAARHGLKQARDYNAWAWVRLWSHLTAPTRQRPQHPSAGNAVVRQRGYGHSTAVAKMHQDP